MSCSFRQTNIVWVLYAYTSSHLTYLRFGRASSGQTHPQMLHDRPCLAASLSMACGNPRGCWCCFHFLRDLPQSLLSVLKVLPDILPVFLPSMLVFAAFSALVVWNGGIVLGKAYESTFFFLSSQTFKAMNPITFLCLIFHSCTILHPRLFLDGLFLFLHQMVFLV